MGRKGVGDWLAMPKLTPAHRRLALLRMEGLACQQGLVALLGPIRDALQSQERALQLAQQRREAARSCALHAQGARALDAEIDRALSGLHTTLTAIARSFQGPRGQQARCLLDALFPQGVGPLTRLPYVDQHAAVQRLLQRMRAPEHSQAVAAMGLQEWASLLEELNADFGHKLVRSRPPTSAEVRAADQQSAGALLSVVALILGLFPSDAESDAEARQLLLAPLEEQRLALAALRARRTSSSGDPGGATGKTQTAPSTDEPGLGPPRCHSAGPEPH